MATELGKEVDSGATNSRFAVSNSDECNTNRLCDERIQSTVSDDFWWPFKNCRYF